MIPVVTPKILKRLFPKLIWDVTTTEQKIYLTFDDGPEPEITSQVLAFLSEYNAKATFFCTGHKAESNPEIISEIIKRGHTVGNHGYKHLSGFSTPNAEYWDNYKTGREITQSSLFRPPYGRITPKQYDAIRPESRVVLWSIMSKDFSARINAAQCSANVINNCYPGAIVVFHDTSQASLNLLGALPVILETLGRKGYTFEAIY